jgi:hypothetical protein
VIVHGFMLQIIYTTILRVIQSHASSSIVKSLSSENRGINNTYIYTLECSSIPNCFQICINHIGRVMVSVLASSMVDRGFEPRSDQIKDYNIGICSFSTKHAALRRKSKDRLARNQNNVPEWGDMSISRLYKTQCVRTKHTSSSSH